MMANETGIIIETMREELTRLGVASGQTLIVHGSFKALTTAGLTPEDVIATLMAHLGPSGTLMMPTFTYSYAGIWNVAPFDAATTPGVGNGVLSETLRTWPGALRSGHPTYSVAACGPHAVRITACKERASALGPGSSYDDALILDARVLLLGVGNNRNSMLHYAEVAAGLPYNDIPFRAFWGSTAKVRRAGAVVDEPLRTEFPACSANFGKVDRFLADRKLVSCGTVCGATSMLMRAQSIVEAVVERLQQEPGWLLCDQFICEPCTLRHRRLREKGWL